MNKEHPHVKIVRVRGYDEYRVAYIGLKKDREEAMAAYTDDREDAEGTAMVMERDRDLCVLNDDIRDRSAWPDRFAIIPLNG